MTKRGVLCLKIRNVDDCQRQERNQYKGLTGKVDNAVPRTLRVLILSSLLILIGVAGGCGSGTTVTDTKSRDIPPDGTRVPSAVPPPDTVSTQTKDAPVAIPCVVKSREAHLASSNIDARLKEIADCYVQPNQEVLTDLDKLKRLSDDLAFQQQRPVLKTLYADVQNARELHFSALSEALVQKDADEVWSQWFFLTEPHATFLTLDVFIDSLPRLSREGILHDINSFFTTPPMLNDYARSQPVFSAYINATEEIHTRFKVDAKRIVDISDRVRDLYQTVAKFINEDDYCSAYVVVLDACVLVEEADSLLSRFKIEIYNKSHPGGK